MMFKEITGEWFFHEGEFLKTESFDPSYLRKGKSVYEVLRVLKGSPLFLTDHLERFNFSLSKRNQSTFLKKHNIQDIISKLVEKNGFDFGNIKMVCNIDEKVSLFVYFIPHRYPDSEQYRTGVKMISDNLEREDPGVKAVNLVLREKTESMMIEKEIYEVLLIDHFGNVTEGSKSNVFFIKNDTVYTTPESLVLPGITRKYVLSLCSKNNILVNEQMIAFSDISDYDAVFITGTSPKVLPVNRIDNISYNVNHNILRTIMREYEKIIFNFIEY